MGLFSAEGGASDVKDRINLGWKRKYQFDVFHVLDLVENQTNCNQNVFISLDKFLKAVNYTCIDPYHAVPHIVINLFSIVIIDGLVLVINMSSTVILLNV